MCTHLYTHAGHAQQGLERGGGGTHIRVGQGGLPTGPQQGPYHSLVTYRRAGELLETHPMKAACTMPTTPPLSSAPMALSALLALIAAAMPHVYANINCHSR